MVDHSDPMYVASSGKVGVGPTARIVWLRDAIEIRDAAVANATAERDRLRDVVEIARELSEAADAPYERGKEVSIGRHFARLATALDRLDVSRDMGGGESNTTPGVMALQYQVIAALGSEGTD